MYKTKMKTREDKTRLINNCKREAFFNSFDIVCVSTTVIMSSFLWSGICFNKTVESHIDKRRVTESPRTKQKNPYDVNLLCFFSRKYITRIPNCIDELKMKISSLALNAKAILSLFTMWRIQQLISLQHPLRNRLK